jgi:hypothetical protein
MGSLFSSKQTHLKLPLTRRLLTRRQINKGSVAVNIGLDRHIGIAPQWWNFFVDNVVGNPVII